MFRNAFRTIAAGLAVICSYGLPTCLVSAAAQTVVVAQPADAATIHVPRRRPDDAPQHLQMGSIGELSSDRTIDAELNGARQADESEWPASFYAVIGRQTCTSALIGRQVVLTAAHCVRTGGTIAFTLNSIAYTGDCERHPEYGPDTNPTADFALCLVRVPVPAVPLERLGLDPVLLGGPSRPEILLTGFGCATRNPHEKLDLIYRIGEAQVIGGPVPPDHFVKVKGGAVVCFGDSGGPGFRIRPGQPRLLVTVNSMVEPGQTPGFSFVSSLSPAMTQKFLKDWQIKMRQRHPSAQVAICGLDADASGCRP